MANIKRSSIVFQFHKGTIRTILEDWSLGSKTYFNSIKVRLEPLPALSKMVETIFQFHKGTIRTKRIDEYYHKYPISIP